MHYGEELEEYCEKLYSFKKDKKQIGGCHYKKLPIQPIEFISKNRLGYCEGNVIKYVCRYKDKGGKDDLLKAIHYLELLIEEEYGE